jgi:hypothetical protein
LGSPVVSKAVIHLDHKLYHGREFTIIAENNSSENIYIQSASLDAKPFTHSWISRDDVIRGGTLKLVMGPKPNPNWGSAQADRPPATMPADFPYPHLPKPSSTGPVAFPLPIRVLCGGDEPAGDFVPDANTTGSGSAHADGAIDTSAAHAAPAEVYQNEFYGKNITSTFPVPAGGTYLVRLHFAEIADNTVGYRREDVSINGQQVLTNFDILAAAGGFKKAVVRDFSDIKPDAQGNIIIHITSTPDSPDQNAKISGIEILGSGSSGN